MKKALFYTVMFAFIQIVASTVVPLVWKWVNGGDALHNATVMILTMALFSLVTLVVFLGAKWCEVSPHWIRTRPWFVLFWCVVAALGALVPSSWIQEQMPALPNVIEEELDTILKDRMGYFVVGLFAPLVEEIVFRGAILRELLRWNSKPWVGIVISAALCIGLAALRSCLRPCLLLHLLIHLCEELLRAFHELLFPVLQIRNVRITQIIIVLMFLYERLQISKISLNRCLLIRVDLVTDFLQCIFYLEDC